MGNDIELGSEYNLSLNNINIIDDNIFRYLDDFENCTFFDSGRSALKCVSECLGKEIGVLLPEFICESVSNCFKSDRITFYRLNDNFVIDVDDLAEKIRDTHARVIYIMHYFGAVQPDDILRCIRELADNNDMTIIEDTTHSFFSEKNTIGDYVICSIRKWMPVPNGGVLYFNNDKAEIKIKTYKKGCDNHRAYGMILKDLYLKTGYDCNAEYRSIFNNCEEALDNQQEIFEMSDFTKFIASCISIEDIKKRRRHNYEKLNCFLQKNGIKPSLFIRPGDTPLTYPLRVHHRDELRRYLMENRIYCAVHWPFDGFKPDQRQFAKKNADELISLPIDQRYDDQHMEYLISILKKYGGDLLY